jgi:hypothetical protein
MLYGNRILCSTVFCTVVNLFNLNRSKYLARILMLTDHYSNCKKTATLEEANSVVCVSPHIANLYVMIYGRKDRF